MNDLERHLLHAQSVFRDAGFMRVCMYENDASEEDIECYDATLSEAKDEKPIQKLLTQRPWLLTGELGGGCRWVLPEVQLGSQYRADFLVARLDSTGVKWIFVELESPTSPLFTKDRRPQKKLGKGISQILEWRSWVDMHRSYAQKTGPDGLNLLDISGRSPGLLLIGRETHRTDKNREALHQWSFEHRIGIHSYDWPR
ncbi:Shedu anti-phage system protein SduA domain-containing protein [Microtetraspora malaysiensis]|uniref:Shedu anti-phage system protein SduA domain-containing protein n=1 Tax=Microtetraspora malaysiensis TaxID=161358 RepID=A0ABW6T4W9_9ACTN